MHSTPVKENAAPEPLPGASALEVPSFVESVKEEHKQAKKQGSQEKYNTISVTPFAMSKFFTSPEFQEK